MLIQFIGQSLLVAYVIFNYAAHVNACCGIKFICKQIRKLFSERKIRFCQITFDGTLHSIERTERALHATNVHFDECDYPQRDADESELCYSASTWLDELFAYPMIHLVGLIKFI